MDPILQAVDKKIFFVAPHPVVREIIIDLISAGYEVYILKDHLSLPVLLRLFPHSIVYLNFDVWVENKLEEFIQSLQGNSRIINARIGLLTASPENKDKYASYYVCSLGIQCGFIELNLDLGKCKQLILSILELNEARGKRKYVRVKFEDDVYFNLHYKNALYMGVVKDISIAGMACIFAADEVELPLKTLISEVKVIIKEQRFHLPSYLAAIRPYKSTSIYILMFDPQALNPSLIHDLSSCIFTQLQNNLKTQLKELRGVKNDRA